MRPDVLQCLDEHLVGALVDDVDAGPVVDAGGPLARADLVVGGGHVRPQLPDQLGAGGDELGAGVLAHDAVVSGIVICLSLLGTRVLPAPWRAPAAVALVVWGGLSIASVPVLTGLGVREGLAGPSSPDAALPRIEVRGTDSPWRVVLAARLGGTRRLVRR